MRAPNAHSKILSHFWEKRILMPFVTKNGGHGGPTLQNVGGPIQTDGAIGPFAPAYFHGCLFQPFGYGTINRNAPARRQPSRQAGNANSGQYTTSGNINSSHYVVVVDYVTPDVSDVSRTTGRALRSAYSKLNLRIFYCSNAQ